MLGVRFVCLVWVVLVCVSFSPIARGEGAGPAGGLAAAARVFDFSYSVVVTGVPADAESVKVWIPLPRTTGAQSVGEISIEGSEGFEIVRDARYGNSFAYMESGNGAERPRLRARYRVERSARADLSGGNGARLTRAEVSDFLRPSRMIRVDGVVGLEARRIAGDARGSLDIARRLYDHIVDTVRYDKSGEGWGRGDSLYACDARAGNCTDFHSLFIGEARSLGLPARFLMGFSVPAELESGVIPGYHCWAEFYDAEKGWLPLDASEAFRRPERRDSLFGGLDANRVVFTRGRDIELPGMAGAPLNYAIYPYVEVDGEAHGGMETEYRFSNAE